MYISLGPGLAIYYLFPMVLSLYLLGRMERRVTLIIDLLERIAPKDTPK